MRVANPSLFRVVRRTADLIGAPPVTINIGTILTGNVPFDVVAGQWGFVTGTMEVQKDGTAGIVRARYNNVGTSTITWNHNQGNSEEITPGVLPAGDFWVPMLCASFAVTAPGSLLIDLLGFSLTTDAFVTKAQMAVMVFPVAA